MYVSIVYMDAYEILVIVLSVTLAIFLVLAIILTVLLIRVANKLNIIADEAEIVAENVASASNTIRQFAAPTAIAQLILKLIKK